MFKSVVVVTHVFSPGTSQAFRDYLLKEGKEVLFIGHPLFGNIFSWSWGALETFWRVFRKVKTYDLYFGSNNLNAFIGIVLKKIGRVKKVIFFTPDYSLKRFNNIILDRIYLWLDYFCLRRADIVWNSTSIMPLDLMAQEREKRGVPVKYRSKQISVPDGTDDIETLPFSRINRHTIGFVGHLKEGMGLELLIEVFPRIAEIVPQARLLIIGSGPIEEKLRQEALGANIEFTGFIGEISRVYQLLSQCAFAVAPYAEGTISQYTDPGKVKVYLSCGLPMVITRVPRVALEIEKEGCGICIDYDRQQLMQAMIKFLTDDALLQAYRQNTKNLAEKYRWDKIFSAALERL